MRKSLIITVVIALLCLCGCEAVVTVPESPEPTTRAQEEAMRTGSMFGFHVPGADPKNYDKDGKPLAPKDRGDAR